MKSMIDKLKEAREKLNKHLQKIMLGAALATTVVSCGEKKEKYIFDEQKDFTASVIKDGDDSRHIFLISANTFQLDSLSAVENIAERLSAAVDREDRKDVAAIIYNNINTIEQAAEGIERPALDKNDPLLQGTKGYGYSAKFYANPKFNNVETEVQTKISRKKSTYKISVETPNGYSGDFGRRLRNIRVDRVMCKNYAKDKSFCGIIR